MHENIQTQRVHLTVVLPESMDKAHIINEIRRTAEANGGTPLGRERFEQETGIKESAWSGKYWTRWSNAVREAGLSPNVMNQPHPIEDLLRPLALLALELGRIPTQPEMNLKRRNDPSFPSPDSIRRRLGRKNNLAAYLLKFSNSNLAFKEVAAFCLPHVEQEITDSQGAPESDLVPGHVYLLKHGNEYKIGRSTDPTRRYKEIRVQMPLETEEVHVIETDDTVGIEAYWHNRFSGKRLNGEWFRLNVRDVSAFKKRKFM